jgi:DNA-binding PadR family transcriptional regulator
MARANEDFGRTFLNKGVRGIAMKLVLLKRISKGEIYSYALLKEIDQKSGFFGHLRRHGVGIKNDIYNTMKALEKSGYIRMDARIDNGRLKKYYSITKSGKDVLKQTRRILTSSMQSLMEITR